MAYLIFILDDIDSDSFYSILVATNPFFFNNTDVAKFQANHQRKLSIVFFSFLLSFHSSIAHSLLRSPKI
jgi:hypothetical protein